MIGQASSNKRTPCRSTGIPLAVKVQAWYQKALIWIFVPDGVCLHAFEYVSACAHALKLGHASKFSMSVAALRLSLNGPPSRCLIPGVLLRSAKAIGQAANRDIAWSWHLQHACAADFHNMSYLVPNLSKVI